MLSSYIENLGPSSTLADLPSHIYQVAPAALGQQVAVEFERRADLPGVIVQTGAGMVGMISRQTFYHQMSQLFSREIYLKRPIQVFLNTDLPATLCLPSTCVISEGARLALERPRPNSYEPIVIQFSDGRLALLDAYALLLAQAQLLSIANDMIQLQKDAAEAANRAKSTFLANMSHEIRTLMNGILGMTDLVLGTELTSEQSEYMEIVKASADSLLTLLNDILDFSKIEAGKIDLDPHGFRLRDSVGDALKMLALRAHQKSLELNMHIQPSVPDSLHADWTRLRQVLVNLVNNALKFTHQGEVVVQIGLAYEQQAGDLPIVDKNKPMLHFAVRDTGIGIPLDKQKLIFDPFLQADGSTTRRYGGTGLGLTICARMVDLMGGKIWVVSEPDRGSTFHFTAPVQVVEAAEPTTPLPAETLHDLPVLIVDDNATNRKVMREMVRGWRMKPTVVEGGASALDELKRAGASGDLFPLVLLDALMPHMDGFTLVEHIKRQPQWAGATIMMLSSADRQGDLARCRELGVARYLTKPIKQSELLEAILSALAAPTSGFDELKHAASEAQKAIPSRPLRILLAEDNAFNQKLAVRLLEKQGHEVVVANNGYEAVEAVAGESLDLVLMDVQMPVMDGFEATATIRDREEGSGRRLPIIALTAHAMKGDRERCLEAGMDGYLSKPIQVKELLELLARVAAEAAPREDNTEPPAADVDESILDQEPLNREEALARLGDDVFLRKELVDLFLVESPRLLGEINQAVRGGDAAKLQMAAHALKGAAGNLGAGPVFQAAHRLEKMADQGDLVQAPAMYQSLEKALARLGPALADFVAAGDPR